MSKIMWGGPLVWNGGPTDCELSTLPTGCVPLQPCGDLKISQLRGTHEKYLTFASR